jgi:hypothetical protein
VIPVTGNDAVQLHLVTPTICLASIHGRPLHASHQQRSSHDFRRKFETALDFCHTPRSSLNWLAITPEFAKPGVSRAKGRGGVGLSKPATYFSTSPPTGVLLNIHSYLSDCVLLLPAILCWLCPLAHLNPIYKGLRDILLDVVIDARQVLDGFLPAVIVDVIGGRAASR